MASIIINPSVYTLILEIMTIGVSLIGFGKSGGRFLQTLLHRQRIKGDIKINAICDSNPNRLSGLNTLGLKTCPTVEETLNSGDSEIFIISTNEDSHFDIISKIRKGSKKYKKIIVEKLLVENYKQAKKLSSIFKDQEISINFVERHSIIIKEVKEWIHVNKLTVSRAGFKWGKYRLHDSRPTVGVLSEISHPLDLILMLSDTPIDTKFKVINGSYIYSNYSNINTPLLDSIDVTINFDNGLIINGGGSFLWDTRERKIILFLSNHYGIVQFMAVLEFDKPHWDIDKCIIYDVSSTRKIIKTFEVKKDEIDSEILCISKIWNLIDESIQEINNGTISDTIAHLEQGVYIQNIIQQLSEESHKKNIKLEIFGTYKKGIGKESASDKLLYKYIKGGDIKGEMIGWDEEF